MLTHLQIRDFAIIDLIELEVRAGLTVLTGETGAGKSIVVDALALLAGGKGGAEVVRAGAERAELSATFDISDSPAALRELLAEQSVEADDELTVRRVVATDGRSRSYLNGVSVPLTLLRDVGGMIVDIHGQHEFQSLTRSAAQRELLDDFGKNTELAASVREAHKIWIALVNRTVELEGKARDRDSRIELLRHQVSELKALDLKENEVAQLAEERTRHSNRGRLAEAAQAAVGLLYDSDEGNAHATASRALAGIKTLSSVDPRLAKVVPMVDEATIQIREAARELSRYLETLDIDPARQEEVERRLAAIEELSRKHRVSSNELIARAGVLEQELAELDSADNNLNALKKQQAEALDAYRKLAMQLSTGRLTAARALSKDITARMQTLGMAGGRFLIEVTQPNGEPSANGFDVVEFRVTANPGQPLRPLAKVASGGELARLSLAVQVACSAKDARCMVFDEVDSGVGGAVAEIVGRELKALGFSGQAICVTHLPQVASQGHHHLRVAKLTDGKTTRTTLSELTMDERAEELARMLGGLEVTGKAREHAREMLQLAASPDQKSRGGKRKA
ncbi:MAG TPA: DNA repair protein RecN [Steroidobacteraceae bacterium]|jgi:DNA repair protein RecN (Recombination protein N)|nr:DNA repair protein RecN [Steroidobacteraceae bacterium]